MSEAEAAERVEALRNPGLRIITVRNTASGEEADFSEEAWDAFKASLEGRHDPEVSCNCESGAAGRCEYAQLSDAVIDAFNPPDNEDAQVAICIAAVERARDALSAMPCSCTPEMIEDWDQCPRCSALGQRGGKAVQR